MPQDPPIRDQNRANRPALVDGIVRAERAIEIALVLPISLVVGWGLGALLDKWLHQHWIYLAGIVLGAVAGFIEMLRLVKDTEKSS